MTSGLDRSTQSSGSLTSESGNLATKILFENHLKNKVEIHLLGADVSIDLHSSGCQPGLQNKQYTPKFKCKSQAIIDQMMKTNFSGL